MSTEIDSESRDRRDCDRRGRRFHLVLHERRSGFDRRRPATAGRFFLGFEHVLSGLRQHPRTVWMLLAAVNVLNLADYFLTLNVLASGGGEANPIMRSLFDVDPLYAGLFKTAAVLVTTLIVWKWRRFRSALEAALVIAVIFGFVILYHMIGLATLV